MKKTKAQTNQPRRYPFIIVEGNDGAGKGTQTKLLVAALKKGSHDVAIFDFPQYETSPFGRLCGEALDGAHGDFRNMSPHIASLPFMVDRLLAKPNIKLALEMNGDIVVSNRYTPSNVAYQAAKLKGKAREQFIDWLENAEYDELLLPKPSLVLYLYVPIKISQGLVANKEVRDYLKKKGKGGRDQHEADIEFQKEVSRVYQKFARERDDWKLIKCTSRGKILSREEIHALVMREVTAHLQVLQNQ